MATQKQVTIIARYTNKKTGVVSYLVRSSDGKSEYCTTLIDGKASGCSCPASRGKCYHRTQLEAKEAGRPFAAKSLPVWTVKLVETGKLAVPGTKKAAPKVPVAKIIAQAVTAKVPATTDLSKKGNLNTGQGFRMMR